MWPFKKRKNEAKARDEPQRSRRMPNLRWINRPRADNTIQGNEAIYAAVSRIANTVASLPMHIYKDYMLVPEHPMERLLNLEPNPNFTAFGFRQTMEVLRNTEGNAYALKIPDGLGGVKRLDILNPTRVQPLRNPEDQSVWYQIQPEDGEVMYAPGFMVLNLRHMSANGQKGIRPIDVLRKSLDYDTQVKELSLQQLDGVNNAIALTVPNSSLSQDEKDDLVDRFLETYEQSGRSVLVLEGGLTATNFSNPAVDGQLLDVERITRNRVATVYNLPPHMLGDYTDTSFSTAEQQMQEFLQLTIIPIVEQWEEEFNRKLLTPEDFAAGYRIRFDTSQLKRADTVATANKNQMAIRGGWLTPNEVRQSEYLPADEFGDNLMASRDLLPLRIAVEQPELLLGGTASGSGDKTKEEKEADARRTLGK